MCFFFPSLIMGVRDVQSLFWREGFVFVFFVGVFFIIFFFFCFHPLFCLYFLIEGGRTVVPVLVDGVKAPIEDEEKEIRTQE